MVKGAPPGYSVTTTAMGKFRSGSKSMPTFCKEITPNNRATITITVMAMGLFTASFDKCMWILLKGYTNSNMISGCGSYILPYLIERKNPEWIDLDHN
jgi:hypothetical protein